MIKIYVITNLLYECRLNFDFKIKVVIKDIYELIGEMWIWIKVRLWDY